MEILKVKISYDVEPDSRRRNFRPVNEIIELLTEDIREHYGRQGVSNIKVSVNKVIDTSH